jgi:hypothetical protein
MFQGQRNCSMCNFCRSHGALWSRAVPLVSPVITLEDDLNHSAKPRRHFARDAFSTSSWSTRTNQIYVPGCLGTGRATSSTAEGPIRCTRLVVLENATGAFQRSPSACSDYGYRLTVVLRFGRRSASHRDPAYGWKNTSRQNPSVVKQVRPQSIAVDRQGDLYVVALDPSSTEEDSQVDSGRQVSRPVDTRCLLPDSLSGLEKNLRYTSKRRGLCCGHGVVRLVVDRTRLRLRAIHDQDVETVRLVRYDS